MKQQQFVLPLHTFISINFRYIVNQYVRCSIGRSNVSEPWTRIILIFIFCLLFLPICGTLLWLFLSRNSSRSNTEKHSVSICFVCMCFIQILVRLVWSKHMLFHTMGTKIPHSTYILYVYTLQLNKLYVEILFEIVCRHLCVCVAVVNIIRKVMLYAK